MRVKKIKDETVYQIPPTQDEFNKIGDLRPYLLQHPDAKMVRRACLHYLGDEVQEYFDKKESK